MTTKIRYYARDIEDYDFRFKYVLEVGPRVLITQVKVQGEGLETIARLSKYNLENPSDVKIFNCGSFLERKGYRKLTPSEEKSILSKLFDN